MSTRESFMVYELDGMTPKTDVDVSALFGAGSVVVTRGLAARGPPVATHLGGGKYLVAGTSEDESMGTAWLTSEIPNANPSRLSGAFYKATGPFHVMAFYDVDGALWAGALATVGLYVDFESNAETAPALVPLAGNGFVAFSPSALDLSEGRSYRVDAAPDCYPARYDGDFYTGAPAGSSQVSTIQAVREVLVADSSIVTLVGQKLFPNAAPQGTAAPFVVLQVVSDVPENTLENTDSLSNSRVQIDCYAERYLDAQAVAAAVDAVMKALSSPDLSAWREVSRDLYEDETQLHRVSADFSVWR